MNDILAPSDLLCVQETHCKVEVYCLLVGNDSLHFSKPINGLLSNFIVPYDYRIERSLYSFVGQFFAFSIVREAIVGGVFLKSKFLCGGFEVGGKRERLIYDYCPCCLLAINLSVFSEVSCKHRAKFIPFLLDYPIFTIRFIGDNLFRVYSFIALRSHALHVLTRGNENPLLLLLIEFRRIREEDIEWVNNLAPQSTFLDSVLAFRLGIPIVVIEVRAFLYSVINRLLVEGFLPDFLLDIGGEVIELLNVCHFIFGFVNNFDGSSEDCTLLVPTNHFDNIDYRARKIFGILRGCCPLLSFVEVDEGRKVFGKTATLLIGQSVLIIFPKSRNLRNAVSRFGCLRVWISHSPLPPLLRLAIHREFERERPVRPLAKSLPIWFSSPLRNL